MRFTKRLRGFKRLSVPLRRLHFDLIFCYKFVFGLVNVNFEDFFTFSPVLQACIYYCTSLGVIIQSIGTFFVERVVNVWNSLPCSVNFSSLTSFKQSIRYVNFDDYLRYPLP